MNSEVPRTALFHTYKPHSNEDAHSDSDLFVEVMATAGKVMLEKGQVSGFYIAGGKFANDMPPLAIRYARGIRKVCPDLPADQSIMEYQAYTTGAELRSYWEYLSQIGATTAVDLALNGHNYIKTIVERRAPRHLRQNTHYFTAEQVLTAPDMPREYHELVKELQESEGYQHLQEYLERNSRLCKIPYMDLVLDGVAAVLGPRKFRLEGQSTSH